MILDWLTSGYRASHCALRASIPIDFNKRGAVYISNNLKRAALSIVAGGDGSQNTTPPADDPGFANVGIRGSGSDIYLGNGWVLTATHVVAGGTWLNNTWYDEVPNSAVQLTNPTGVAYTPNTDLTLFQVNGRPNLPSLSIESASPATGWNVIMIGNGRNRNPSEAYWTSSWLAASSPSPYAGYIWAATNNIRWGTNVISTVGVTEGVGANSETAFSTQFTGNTPSDAQGSSGDSGGGVFHKDANGQWQLAGVMFAINNLIGQPLGISVFGDVTYSADLSVYRSEILNIIGVNHAPAGASKTIATPQDTPYTFATADFGFSDPHDTPPNNLLAVKITTLPTAGTLVDNGAAVSAGQFIAVADISGGELQFDAAPGASGTSYASFTFQVQDDGGTANGGVDLDPSPKTMTVNVTPRPQVMAVLVDGTSWSPTFLSNLQASGLGSGGYSIPVGSAAQLQTLPWVDLNQIKVVFSENVNVQANSLVLTGLNVAQYAVSGFSYAPATFTATWTLSNPINTDKLLVDLHSSGPAAVTDAQGNPLDGEWVNRLSKYPTGSPNGDFQFDFNVLAGDLTHDGIVNGQAVSLVSADWGQTTGINGDANGDGAVNGLDIAAISANWLQSLPAGSASGSGASATASTISTGSASSSPVTPFERADRTQLTSIDSTSASSSAAVLPMALLQLETQSFQTSQPVDRTVAYLAGLNQATSVASFDHWTLERLGPQATVHGHRAWWIADRLVSRSAGGAFTGRDTADGASRNSLSGTGPGTLSFANSLLFESRLADF